MTPDRGYRTSVRRLLVASWVLAVVMFVVSLAVFDRFPFAGVIAGLMSIGCLRMAAEVHDEIRRWRQPVPTYRDQLGAYHVWHWSPGDDRLDPEPPARATSIQYGRDRYERDETGTWRQVEWG